MISLRDIITERRATIPDDEIKERSWVLVFRYNPAFEILLARDEDGKWSFPGGQWDEGESAEDAAWRELEEETGLVPDTLNFLKTVYHDKPNKLKVSHVFYTEVSKDVKVKASDDVEKLKWFRSDDLPDLDDLSKPKQEVVDLAAKEIYDAKKELKEYVDLFTSIGYNVPQTLLTEEKKRTQNGYLIVFEGIDGVGKTTQRRNLKEWLEKKGWKVSSSKWGTSPTISKLIKVGKIQKWLSPMLFSLLHASDMIWRYENEIKPALEKGHVVLCDRYCYTSYVRDKLRGIRPELLDQIYSNFVEPDLVIHFEVEPHMAVERLLRDKGFKWYNSGMDIGYSGDQEECALAYEKNMDREYKKLLPKVKNYKHVNTNRSIEEIFEELKGFVREKIEMVRKDRLNENAAHPGTIDGWLEPNGTCHYVADTHSAWASRTFGIPIPKETDPGYMRAAIRLNQLMSQKGWVVVIVTPRERTVFVDAGEVSWNSLTRYQRDWIREISQFGYKILGGKIIVGNEPQNPPYKIKSLIAGKEYSPNMTEGKLSFFGMMKEVLLERMSFADLYNRSDPARIKRANNVRVRPLKVTTMDGNEAWTFRYKSSPSTTGSPWKGYVQFFKDDVTNKENAGEIDCMVDCSCPDYRYRWAYANAKQDASKVGAGSWSGCINSPPKVMNPGEYPGMCKHLIALGEYLKTNIEPDAPEPEQPTTRPMYEPRKVKPKVKPIVQEPVGTIDAPDPDDGYSDVRAGSLQEGRSQLYDRIDNFAKNNVEFDVMYEDE